MTKAILHPGVQDNGPAYAVSFQGKTKQVIDQAKKDGFPSSLQMSDALAQRQALARKQAHKIVSDAFGNEKKLDVNVQGMRDLSDNLRRDSLEASDEIDALKALIVDARKQHGVEEGSEEDWEVDLLRHADSPEGMAFMQEEERERAEEIKKRGLSQSQKDFLEHTRSYYDRIDDLKKQMDQNDAVIRGNNAAERQIEIERLKTDPIGDAQEEADAVLEEANNDMISSLFDEARDHIDEEREKTEETAEEKAKEEAEKQERIDTVKERKAVQEALTEAATDLAGVREAQDQVKAKVYEVLDKLKLLPEDIKGTEVDDII